MPASKSTENYNFPIYAGTDRISILGDFNTAFSTLDAELKETALKASDAINAATAGSAVSVANKTKIENLSTRVSAAEATANVATESVATAVARATTAEETAAQARATAVDASDRAYSANATAGNALEKSKTALAAVDSISASKIEDMLVVHNRRVLADGTTDTLALSEGKSRQVAFANSVPCISNDVIQCVGYVRITEISSTDIVSLSLEYRVGEDWKPFATTRVNAQSVTAGSYQVVGSLAVSSAKDIDFRLAVTSDVGSVTIVGSSCYLSIR